MSQEESEEKHPHAGTGQTTPTSSSIKSVESPINDGDLSTTPSSPIIAHEKDFNYSSRSSGDARSSTSSMESMMNLTPYSSNNSTNQDDFVIYSDSDVGSLNSLSLPHNYHYHNNSSSASETDSTISKTKDRLKKKKTSPSSHLRSSSVSDSRRDSLETTPTPKSKKRIRRKSKNSDHASEKSSIRHPLSNSSSYNLNPEYQTSSGYTLTPATGKIFRNLLILEESLREQVIQQRALRRKYLTFLSILCSLIASISHHLYFNNDVNSSSNGGPIRVILQIFLLSLIVTLMLYHLSGEYQKTIVLPRKFLSSTNKGLRQLNVRLVKIKTPWTDSIIDLIREFVLLLATMCLDSLHKVYPSIKGNKDSKVEVFLVSCQLQCQPRIGVTDVKLVLNARVFNTDVREGWELYRSEFWIHEGVRRRNAMMAFVNESYQRDSLNRERLLNKDKKDRKDRRKSSHGLSERNLNRLAKLESASDQTTMS